MAHSTFTKIRFYFFLRDVLWLALTAFGGPQVHLALFIDLLVRRRGYIKEEEFLELNALCQILPGPSSSQTLVAIGYKIGGTYLAFLTLFVWIFPAITFMTMAAVLFSFFQRNQISLEFMRFVPPIALGLVLASAIIITYKTVRTKTGLILMLLAAVSAYYFRSAWVFPLTVIISGIATTYKFQKQPKQPHSPLKIRWKYFYLFIGFLVVSAIVGNLIKSKPILIFENFYRNGSLIFGGGQVLTPVLFTEFVQQKQYLTTDEFLSGFAIAQCLPGPVFAFVAFIGALSLRKLGVGGEILGGFLASAGIFLPGTFLIFFVIHFWNQIKTYRFVRASLEGILAASAGLVVGNAGILLEPVLVAQKWLHISLIISTFVAMQMRWFSPPVLILLAILLGVIF
ncbi:MAG: chromate efflux transporter [Microscillaceae bacterium]|nr:chromate efflux transporter [Microscillaceae bacterium]MDW8461533.1 chromate efflux transporter [Cytophagales bacterium]